MELFYIKDLLNTPTYVIHCIRIGGGLSGDRTGGRTGCSPKRA
jgi:hypothetical protein